MSFAYGDMIRFLLPWWRIYSFIWMRRFPREAVASLESCPSFPPIISSPWQWPLLYPFNLYYDQMMHWILSNPLSFLRNTFSNPSSRIQKFWLVVCIRWHLLMVWLEPISQNAKGHEKHCQHCVALLLSSDGHRPQWSFLDISHCITLFLNCQQYFALFLVFPFKGWGERDFNVLRWAREREGEGVCAGMAVFEKAIELWGAEPRFFQH